MTILRSSIISTFWLIFQLILFVGLIGVSLANFPGDRRLKEAQAALQRGEYSETLRRAFDRLDRHPTDPRASRLAALALSRLIFAPEAEPYYEVARTRGYLTLEDEQERALGLLRANLREQAVSAYHDILKIKPEDPMALQRLATLEWTRGRFDQAREAAESLAKSPKGELPGEALLAEIYHDAFKEKEAIPHFRRVLEIDPELSRLPELRKVLYREYAHDLLKEGNASDAREILGTALRHDSSPEILDMLGQACLNEGDNAEAERWWRRSTESHPDRFAPWVYLGRLATETNRLEEALSFLNRAFELKPANYEVLFPLSRIHRLLGHEEEAARFLALANEAQRASAPSTNGMGAPAPSPLPAAISRP